MNTSQKIQPILSLKDLCVSIHEKQVLDSVFLDVFPSEIHVIMGPNGGGKSSLSQTIMGNPDYKVTKGSIEFLGDDIKETPTHERSLKGLFLGFQYPVAIPGLKISEFLKNLYELHTGTSLGVVEFRKLIKADMEFLNLSPSILKRYLNDGFSGGEMKRLEMLQLLLIKPKLAILDELDSGLDIDGQRLVKDLILKLQKSSHTTFFIISHYQAFIESLEPNSIHVLLNGNFPHSGGMDILSTVQEKGYDFLKKSSHSLSQDNV